MTRLAAALSCVTLLLAGCASDDYSRDNPPRPVPVTPRAAGSPAPARSTRPAAPAAAPAASAAPRVPVPLADPNEVDSAPSPDEVPPDVLNVPDAVPQYEPRSAYGNPDSYKVFGKRYVVLDDARGFRERGYASWYGKKFHGKRTSSGEAYDMYAMTGAHKTLPIPSYVRVTNLANGKSVIVKITDRGPFHDGRIIDLSYAAAARIGMLGHGSTLVQIEVVTPDDMPGRTIVATDTPEPAAAPAAPPTATMSATPDAGTVSAATTAVAAPTVPVPATTAAAAPQAAPLHVGLPRFLQAGVFAAVENAVALRDRLAAAGVAQLLLKSETRDNRSVYRVLIGPFADGARLDAARAALAAAATPTVPVAD